MIAVGTGRFQIQLHGVQPNKSITVWSFRPRSLAADSPVLIVLPGAARNGEGYRAQWRKYADNAAALLLVPEFSEEQFPGGAYSAPKLSGAGTAPYSTIEALFDQAVQSMQLSAREYLLYGHSAGAQFAHRLVLFNPQARAKIIVAANAGWYLMPDFTVAYPYGLKNSGIDAAQLKTALAKHLIVLLGEKDTDPNHPALNRGAGAMRQGRQRLERGENFFQAARSAAASLATPFNWQLKTVPNAAHSDSAMAAPAAALLFQ
jgi:poly(3-hydroxybutyrate) depolymerase